MVPHVVQFCGNRFAFQEYNDPKYASSLYRGFLTENQKGITLVKMVWSPQSIDLSLIEFIWNELDCNLEAMNPKDTSDMREKVQSGK
ncbi:hypothetical protein Trydic_g8157 [Trypoxylus dichotomus]